MLARKSLLAFGMDILKAVFGFAATFFIARYLGATALGTVGYLLGLLGALALVSDLGLHQAFRKCASENPDENGGYVTAFVLGKVVLGLLLFGACVAAPWAYPRLAAQLTRADMRGAYWAIAVYYLLNNFIYIPALTFQARRETAKFTLPSTIGALVSSAAKIGMALAHASLTALAIAYTLETACGLIMGLAMFRHYALRRPKREEFLHLLGYAWPMLLVTAIAYILPNVDRILIERFWDASEVGFYTAVLGVMALMQRVPLSAMGLFLAQASEDAAKGDLREIERRVFVLERYLLMITVPLCVAVAVASGQVARLCLGKEFSRSGPILAALAFNPLLLAFFEPYNTVVYAIEKHRYLVLASALELIILLLADAVLVPRSLMGAAMLGLGGLGAALGSLAGQAMAGIVQLGLARRYAGLGPYWRGLKFAAAGLSMAAIAGLVQRVSAAGTVWMTAIALAVGSAVYLAMLAILREFTRTDVQVFLGLLHPGKMLGYVRGELEQ